MSAHRNGKNHPMSPADEMTLKAHWSATQWVKREQDKGYSRTDALKNVADKVGISVDWLRRFVNGSDRVKQPSWHVGHNIIGMYARICDRIENNTERRRKNIARLEERLNEAAARSDSGVGTPKA